MLTLWHYTCRHSVERIGESGLLLPARRLVGSTQLVDWWPGEFVWLTDLSRPIRTALGLTSRIIDCDRTEHRYRVTDTNGVQPWLDVRRHVPHPELIEHASGARPRHWFVARAPVPVVLDDIRRL